MQARTSLLLCPTATASALYGVLPKTLPNRFPEPTLAFVVSLMLVRSCLGQRRYDGDDHISHEAAAIEERFRAGTSCRAFMPPAGR